jgi:manganese/iron transport system permease protein
MIELAILENLLVPFDYEYMRKAILVSTLIGAVCACLSCFITLKGWSLMGDALSHAIVPGVTLAYLAGLPFSAGAFVAGILASLSMGFIKARTRIREDAIIGIVFTTYFAAGLLLISLFPSNIKLNTIIFGNILGIASADILQMVIISAITMFVLLIKWKDLLLYSFDPNQARAIGLNAPFLHFLLLALLAATAVAALQTVGACLVVGMLVTPGATAYLLTDRFGRMMIIATIMGAVTSFIGAYASYFLDGSTGGCIIVLQTCLFLVALFFAPKHGILVSRLMARNQLRRGFHVAIPLARRLDDRQTA